MKILFGVACILYGVLSIVAGIFDYKRDFWMFTGTNSSQRVNNIFGGIIALAFGVGIVILETSS